jgi:hypothetical protein
VAAAAVAPNLIMQQQAVEGLMGKEEFEVLALSPLWRFGHGQGLPGWGFVFKNTLTSGQSAGNGKRGRSEVATTSLQHLCSSRQEPSGNGYTSVHKLPTRSERPVRSLFVCGYVKLVVLFFCAL